MMIRDFKGEKPVIPESAFVAENAVVIGNVTLEEGANIWYHAVLRGDENSIYVGKGSNIQDNCTVHCARLYPTRIGNHVTVGHNAVVHGCVIGDGTMIGMGATVLNGAKIGKGCLIAAGALVKENAEIPDFSLCVGVPAKVVRELDEAAREKILENARSYVRLAKEYEE